MVKVIPVQKGHRMSESETHHVSELEGMPVLAEAILFLVFKPYSYLFYSIFHATYFIV